MMSDLSVPSKRPRVPTFADRNSEYLLTHAAAGSDLYLDEEISPAHIRNFLKVCFFCQKNLSPNEHTFMYGHFGSFCTDKCRKKQMVRDILRGSAEKSALKKVKTDSTEQGPKVLKDEALAKSNTPSNFYIS